MKIPSDPILIQCLIQSLQNAVEAKSEHDKAREEFSSSGGYSWGYHGRSYIQAVEDTSRDFGERLEQLIDARVQAALNPTGE